MSVQELHKLLESLHPLESKMLLCFASRSTLSTQDILSLSSLDESRLDMASGWLQTKGLLEVKDESVLTLVSLTDTGHEYLTKGTPEMRIIRALREGLRFTVKDIIQDWDVEPTDVSSSVGALKEAGVIRIVQGGVLELVASTDISAYEFLIALIKEVEEKDQSEVSVFSQAQQTAIHANFHKRGKSKGIFRITEKKSRSYTLCTEGRELLRMLLERGEGAEEHSVLTPEMLKLGTWRNKKFRAYNIALNPPR